MGGDKLIVNSKTPDRPNMGEDSKKGIADVASVGRDNATLESDDSVRRSSKRRKKDKDSTQKKCREELKSYDKEKDERQNVTMESEVIGNSRGDEVNTTYDEENRRGRSSQRLKGDKSIVNSKTPDRSNMGEDSLKGVADVASVGKDNTILEGDDSISKSSKGLKKDVDSSQKKCREELKSFGNEKDERQN